MWGKKRMYVCGGMPVGVNDWSQVWKHSEDEKMMGNYGPVLSRETATIDL